MSTQGSHRRGADDRRPALRRFRFRPAGVVPAAPEALEPLPARGDRIVHVATSPHVPQTTEVLERLRAGLLALDAEPEPDIPVAFLRNILPGTKDATEPLGGFPVFAGVTRIADGSPVAGLYLGTGDEDGRLVLDALSVTWLTRLIAAAEAARDGLYEQMSGAA